MKRLISIAVVVLAIGEATPEAKAESVADEVIAMCIRNKANKSICEFLARDSNILNLLSPKEWRPECFQVFRLGC